MPNKTIYVKDADAALFEAAEKLGDGESLSGVIAEALKRYVAAKEAEAQGMQEHTLPVGRWRTQGTDDIRKVRFVGRELADGKTYTGQTSDGRDRWIEMALYQTQAGKILVWWSYGSLWEREDDSADYAVLNVLPGYDEALHGLSHDCYLERLPGNLLCEAAEALGQELVEWVE